MMLALLVAALLVGCGSTQRTLERLAEGSCQKECDEQHPDSLYDRDQCLEDCEPLDDAE